MPKRTRPAGRTAERPDRTVPTRKVMPAVNAPYPGCCEPYPDATFVDQELVKVNAHHKGPYCKGYLEPMSLEAFRAEVDARRPVRGDA